MNRIAIGLAAAAAAALPAAAAAEPVTISLRMNGEAAPSEIAFGQQPGLSPMPFNAPSRTYSTTVQVTQVKPAPYAVRLRYGSESYLLPVRLHKYSGRIDLVVQFDAPKFCRDGLVTQAEMPAQENNIEEALAKYLLAVHLSRITDEDGKCRGTQPVRLARAKVNRGIQLSKFYNSPFLPPEADQSEWAALLGPQVAAAYAEQVASSEAVLLDAARIEAQSGRDYAAAAEINAALLENVRADAETAEVYASVGLREALLVRNQDFLETMAASGQ